MNILRRMQNAWWPPKPPVHAYKLALTSVVPGPMTVELNPAEFRIVPLPIPDLGLSFGLVLHPGLPVDLGAFFTQKQILDSQELKRRLADGTIVATNVGTTPSAERVDASVVINPGSITIGQVEIRDGISDIIQSVKSDGSNNAAVVIQNSPTPGVATAAAQADQTVLLSNIEIAVSNPVNGFGIPVYDYMLPTYYSSSTVYEYYVGGSTGILVGTLTVTYTDDSKAVIQTVAKT